MNMDSPDITDLIDHKIVAIEVGETNVQGRWLSDTLVIATDKQTFTIKTQMVDGVPVLVINGEFDGTI